MRAFRIFALCLLQIGCVYVGSENRPVPVSGPARKMPGSAATVEAPDFSMSLRFDGFSAGGFGLFGLVVPVLPVGQWKWLMGIGPDDLRLGIMILLVPRTTEGKFTPGSLRVLEGDRTYQPSGIQLYDRPDCRGKSRTVDPSEILPVSKKMCMDFSFQDVRPPRETFSVVVSDLPKVDFRLERHCVAVLGGAG